MRHRTVVHSSGMPILRIPRRSRPSGRKLRVVIVGAGFSGIAMALAMKRAGRADEMLIVDAADEFGGTWRDNTYPGCACDVPSPVYSLEGEGSDWPRFFAEQPDILAYILRVVDKHGLRRYARLGTEITEQRWDPDTATWTLDTADGDTITADVVINAVGPLTKAVIPDLPGRDRFEGPAFHTAHWRHDVDLAGKRVGVIGTGASAVQIIPEIVDDVAALEVFQRTPSWVLPKPDRVFSSVERALLTRVPGAQWLVRTVTNQILEHGVWRMLERNRFASGNVRRAGLANIRKGISDPALRAAVTPTIEPGCKRILMSNTYYPALARDHVAVHPSGVAEVTPTGVVTADGDVVDLDVIVWGTGFDAHKFWAPMKVHGRDGLELGEVWRRASTAFNSVSAPGFPNTFFLLGPNSGTGHNSVVMVAEAQADYVVKAMDVLRDGTVDWVEPTVEATRAYADEMATRHEDLVWASGCGSWYLNDEGVNDVLYPGPVGHYQRRVADFDRSAHHLGRKGVVAPDEVAVPA